MCLVFLCPVSGGGYGELQVQDACCDDVGGVLLIEPTGSMH